MQRAKHLWETLWPLLLLYGLILLFFWRVITPNLADKMRFKAGDFYYISYPPHYHVAQSLWQGSLPLWNPLVASGYPQCADPQAGCFYPVSLFTALISRGTLTADLLEVEAIIHFALAATFTYLFVRYLWHNRAAAFVSAIVFTFGGYLTSFPPLQPVILESAVWLPAVLWMATLAVDRRKPLYLALGGVFLAMPFLAGQPQIYISVIPLSVAWLMYRARRSGISWAKATGYSALLLGIAGGVFAVQFLPTMELMRLASRAEISYSVTSEGGFSLWELGGIVSPKVFGSVPLYVGLATLALAAVAVVRGRGHFWVVAGFLGLLFSLGKNTFLFDITYLVQQVASPGFLRSIERVIIVFSFALAILAGEGIVALEEGQFDVRVRRGIRWVLIAALVALLPLYVLKETSSQPDTYANFLDAVIFIVLILAATRFALKEASAHAWARWALAGIVAFDLFTTNGLNFLQLYSQDPLAEVETMRPVTGVAGIFRTQVDALTNGDYGDLLGLENVDSDAPLQLRYYSKLLQVDELRREQLLNVHVVATRRVLTHGAFALFYQKDDVNVYTFHQMNPRAYLVADVRFAEADEEAAGILEAADFDPATEAVIQGDTAAFPRLAATPLDSGEKVEITSREPTRIELNVDSASDRLLVYADTFYPGWEAWVDGVPVPIWRANLALRGIVVPKGAHTVSLVYRPKVLYAGAGITLATLLALAAWALTARLADRRRKAAP